MTYDLYFDDVQRQLIEPPPASDAALAAAFRGTKGPVPVDASSAVKLARGRWTVLSFREGFKPEATTPYLPFRLEAGTLDVVRARYRTPEAPRSVQV
jgi:hypothetical protein